MEEYVWVSKLSDHSVFVNHAHPVLMRAAQQHEVTVTIANCPGLSDEEYVAAIDGAVARRVAGMMVIGWGSSAVAPIGRAMDAGIPVVTLDSDVLGSRRLAHVGTNWRRMGEAMADELARLVEGPGKVLVLGLAGLYNMEQGYAGLAARMRIYTRLRLMEMEDDTDPGPGRANEIVRRVLRDDPSVVGIVGLDGNSGPGAAKALEDLGLAGRVKLLCVDADDLHLSYIESGAIQAAFAQKRELFTYLAFQMLFSYNHGTLATGFRSGPLNVPGDVDTGFVIVRRQNIHQFRGEMVLDDGLERLRLERQLRLISLVCETASQIVLVTDLQGRVTYASPETYRATGFRERDLVGQPFSEVLDAPDGSATEWLVGIGPEDRLTMSARVARRDGSQFPVEMTATALASGGVVLGAVVTMRDISDRDASDRRLRGEREILNRVVSNLGAGLALLDPTGRIVWASETYASWFSPSADPVGRTCREALQCGQNDGCAVLAAVQAGRCASLDLRRGIEGQGERLFRVDAVPVLDDARKVGCVIQLVRDVTSSGGREEALERSEALCRAMLESADDAFFAKDADGRYVAFNSRCVAFLGLPSRSALVGKRSAELLSREAAQQMVEMDAEVMRTGQPQRSRVALDRDGVSTYDVVKSPWRDASGNIVGIVGVARDITEESLLERRLREVSRIEALAQLSEAMAGEIASLVFAAADNRSPDDAAIRRASMLAERLRVFAGTRYPVMAPLSINEVAAEVEQRLGPTLPANCRLRLALDPGLGLVQGDRAQWIEALSDLVRNAAEAMPGGGEVGIVTENVQVDATLRRRSPGLECGPYVHLAVHDQGEGVSLSIQERIFRPFFTTRDTGTHTGMGLAIVRGVATNHNGAVFVDRREGGGSVFRVFVPRVGAT